MTASLEGSSIRTSNQARITWSVPRSGWPIQLILGCSTAGMAACLFSMAPTAALQPLALDSPLFELFPAIVVFSVACYTWVRFASTTHGYWLAACLAFLCYSGFSACRVILDVIPGADGSSSLASDWLIPVSRITLAGFLTASALTRRTLTMAGRRGACAQVFVSWAVATGLVLAGLLRLASYVYPLVLTGNETVILLAQIAPHTCATLACLVATAFIATATLREGDASAKLACLWLLPTTISCAVRAAHYLGADQNLLWQARVLDMGAAAVAAIALNIHSAHDQARASEQLHDLEAMHDISWSLAAAANLSAMLSAFVSVLTETAGAKVAALYLLNESGDELTLEAAVGEESDTLAIGKSYSLEPQPRPGFHSGHTARALREQSSQALEDVYSDVEFVSWRTIAQNDGWVVSVPLISRKKAVGVFNVYMVQNEQITKERLHMLETMAALVAPAIESRRNDIHAREHMETARAA